MEATGSPDFVSAESGLQNRGSSIFHTIRDSVIVEISGESGRVQNYPDNFEEKNQDMKFFLDMLDYRSC